MKTGVVMKRVLFDHEIGQKSDSTFLSATDLVKAGNIWRKDNGMVPFNLSQWINQQATKEFIKALEENTNQQVIIKGRGRSANTWMHPMLFMDLALALSPKLKVEMYQWLYDNLLKYRNESGDSYKKMCGSLFDNAKNKTEFPRHISKLALLIKEKVGVDDWEHATEEQLKLRDKIHYNIYLIANVMRDNKQAIEYGIKEALKQAK